MKNKTWPVILLIVILVSAVALFLNFKILQHEKSLRLKAAQELQLKQGELLEAQAALEKLTQDKLVSEKKLGEEIAAMQSQLEEGKKSISDLNSRVVVLNKEKKEFVKASEESAAALLQLKKRIDRLEKEKLELMAKLTEKEIVSKDAASIVTDELKIINLPTEGVSAADPVNLGKIVVQRDTNQAARVENINSLYGFVVISAGSQDGLRKNVLVNITRDDRFIAKALVKEVRGNQSSATLIPEWMRGEIKVGDLVRVD